jgi:hypothetical protein
MSRTDKAVAVLALVWFLIMFVTGFVLMVTSASVNWYDPVLTVVGAGGFLAMCAVFGYTEGGGSR